MNAMSREKFCTTLLLYIIIIGVLILPPTVISLSSASVHIRSTGQIAQMGNATSGSIEDIQAAIDWVTAAGGGTVHIPEGTFTFDATTSNFVSFNVPSGGIQIIGAGIDQTVLQVPERTNDVGPVNMFVIDGLSTGARVRISGITFKGNPDRTTSTAAYTGIRLESCTDFRVDHCSFWDMGGNGVAVYDSDNTYGTYGGNIDEVSQGVVDHCEFYGIYKQPVTSASNGWGYGVVIGRAYHWQWTVPNLYPEDPWTMFGRYYKNTFIEDCYFEGCRHVVCGNWAGAYVLRHSTIEDQGMYANIATGHPVRINTLGMLTCEIYENTVVNTGKYVSKHPGFLVEGGSGLIYSNTMVDTGDNAFVVGACEYADHDFHPLGHTKETYIWGNILIGSTIANVGFSDNSGSGGCPPPIEGVEFFSDVTGIYTTEQIQNMVDSKGYTPFTYPHPLTLQEFP